MTAKKRGLGRGLDALLSGGVVTDEKNSSEGELRQLPVELLQRGQYQPRVDMREDSLADLAESIKAQGVVQPIAVRHLASGNYEIIAGERRWRAAQLAGLAEIPAVVRDVPDEAAIAMALIENIQREDLNPLEEANAIKRLIDEFEMTHQQAGDAVGRSRTAVSNLLRLLELSAAVKPYLESGELEMGHARALLPLSADKQLHAAQTIVAKGLSVREAEALSRALMAEKPKPVKKKKAVDPDVARLENDLSEKLAARVNIEYASSGKGKLQIKFNSLDELEGILGHIR
ncbi:MAG: ParB/RepB/Spo0J family partition protein [Gammaproteobacteria bacterium]|nr:MAG: ParB/RepB/Spo0J family partition protein [Gammaproteobacteria bacterium]